MTANEIIVKEFSFDLLEQTEGSIETTVTYTLPSVLEQFRVSLPATASVIGTDGFDAGSTGLEWDGEAVSPSVTIEKRAKDESTRFGGYSFTDTGGWAITQKPTVTESWGGTTARVVEEIETQENVATSSDGYIVYVGPYDEVTVRGAQQRIRVVVPEAGSLVPTRHAVRQTLKYASKDLLFGSRSDEVVAIAAPGDSMSGLLAGLQSGISGFWVKDSQRVDTPHNTWVHEYVHTRQDITRTKSTRWLIEGSANYYAALTAYNQRLTTYDQFHSLVSTSKDERAVLAEPDRWPSPYTDYKKGCRVLAALDVEIRTATNGERTLQSVLWEANRTDGRLTHPRLRSIVEDVGTERLGAWIDEYARSTAVPDVPHRPDLFDPDRTVPVDGRQPVCPFCDVPESGRYCDTCGTDLEQECPVCETPVAGSESRCMACGTEIVS